MVSSKARSAGYTLIELMAVLSIASMLLLVALPAFQTQVRNSRLTGASTDLLSTYMNARAEASARANFVTVCKRNEDATACVNGEADDWELGWITFIDENANGAVDAGDEVIQIHEPLDREITAVATGQLVHRITYRPNGLTNLTGTEAIIICDKRGFRNNGAHTKAVVVSLLGKASILNGEEAGESSCQP